MNKIRFVLLIVILIGCRDNSSSHSIILAEEEELTYEEVMFLIHEHRTFELENNNDFYNTLIRESNQYYSNVTNEFLEKEYSLSGSFSEIDNIVNKTPEERFTLWENKLNSYFSSTAYESFINSRIKNHYRNLNKQRREGLEKPLRFLSEDSLEIGHVPFGEFRASKIMINQSIKESRKKIKENLRRLAYNTAEVASVITTGGASGAVVVSVESIGMSEMIYELVIPDKSQTREILENEYQFFLEKNRVDLTQELNDNTNQYYEKLIELINKRKNEKILF